MKMLTAAMVVMAMVMAVADEATASGVATQTFCDAQLRDCSWVTSYSNINVSQCCTDLASVLSNYIDCFCYYNLNTVNYNLEYCGLNQVTCSPSSGSATLTSKMSPIVAIGAAVAAGLWIL